LEEAHRVLEGMKKAGVPPDVFTFTTLMSAYGKCCTLAGSHHGSVARAECIALTCAECCSLAGKGGQWRRAAAALAEMKAAGVQPDGRVYSAMIYAFGRGGQWEQARKAFEEMKAAGLHDLRAYGTLIDAYLKCGQSELAKAAVKERNEAGIEEENI
jgi:pentatricopeptide repeat domain-containing protein 1